MIPAEQQNHLSQLQVDPQAQDQADSIQALGPVFQSTRDRPDARTQRYDRQLRLWASSGQASLESANVLLIGATHLGAQVLKNLILPGVGSFTVLDGQKVGPYDLGNNFFLEPDSVGKSRAQEVARCLAELNPSVVSKAKVADPGQLLDRDPSFFTSFSLIIAANQPLQVMRPLAELAWLGNEESCIPLMSVSGAGMVGEVKVQIKEMTIIETHPASTIDLRLTTPWPELSAYASSYDIEDRDAMAQSHVPYIVILLRALQKWKATHNGTLPSPKEDRKSFTECINSLRDPSNPDLENFEEAGHALGQHVWRPISSESTVPEDIWAILSDRKCRSVTAKSSNFWLMARALLAFIGTSLTAEPSGGGGVLPLPGSLPDFKATSSGYIELQRLYRAKAERDLRGLRGHLRSVLAEVGLPADSVHDEELETFAKHAAYLKCVRGRSFKDRLNSPAIDVIAMAFREPVNPVTIQHHVAFLLIDAYHSKHRRFPGSSKAFSESIIGCSSSSPPSNGDGPTNWEGTGIRSAPLRGLAEPERKRHRSDSPFTVSFRESTAYDDGGDSHMKEVTQSDNEESYVDHICDELECMREGLKIIGKLALPNPDYFDMIADAVKEMVRSGHADIASTASLLGGVAAQEAIKIITRQYIPLEGVAVYDGIKQAIGSFVRL